MDSDCPPVLQASRLTTLVVLAWSAVGTGTLLILTGPPIVTPHIAAGFAAAFGWPHVPGALFAAGGAALAWSLWRSSRRLLVVSSLLLAALYGLLALGFAIQAVARLKAGQAEGFVYPVAVYAGLAALHAVQADTTIRGRWR